MILWLPKLLELLGCVRVWLLLKFIGEGKNNERQ
jgi:hypothetical protein